ncbi:MAG: VOC family protein [Deltaproteobacteria bacterium]|nr:VOC family protein [Deltaproteobacteria bacterium]MBW2416439.1 VOC family protein [Deltaproteobacteria bacterium]
MLALDGVYEVAIRVKSLTRAEPFYCDVLGLKPGLRDERRNWLFLNVGRRSGMVVLQEDPGDWPLQHFAFRVAKPEIARAAELLTEAGVAVRGPIHHDWMGADSLYFDDPDGNELELCAVAGRD